MSRTAFLIGSVLLACAAPTAAAAPAAAPSPAGDTRACLQIGALRDTVVRNDRTIDFVLRDGSVWRSSLPFRCTGLGFQRAFSYQTSISQLCKQDLITVLLQSDSQVRGASCALGEFRRLPPPPAKTP